MRPLLDDLNEAQRSAVTTDAGPLCILAGAGSGKTRVLTRRIAHRIVTGSADAPHVLALTFTRKSAGELRSRLRTLGVRDAVVAGTFHAVAYAQLRQRWADRGQPAPSLLERKVRVLGPILARQRATTAAVQPVDVAGEIEWAKARLVSPEAYTAEAERAGRTPPLPPSQLAAVYERYETEKKRRGLLDFDDLVARCGQALVDDEEFAAAQRWRFRHLFVDEFQDVNPAQFRLLEGWLGGRDDLCVVGDPNQAIYGWNGADPQLLERFCERFPRAAVVRLDDNYRSSPQVLAVANAVLATGLRRASPLRAHEPDGPVPVVTAFDDDRAEARGIAARIRKDHGPSRPWSHVAVLVRTNAQTALFEEAFRAARIPYRVRGGGGFLAQPEVQAALATLAGGAAAVPFDARVTDLELLANGETGTEERRLSLEEVVRLAREYASLDARPTTAGFRGWLAATVSGDEPEPEGDAVELVTLHRAKGLEWPIVFVAGLEKGLVPIGRAQTDEAEAEERRLLYVALTRARRELHCSWARRRTFGPRSVARQPSPWLGAIERVVAAMTEGHPGDWRSAIERERARLRTESRRRGASGGRLRHRGAASSTAVALEPDPAVFAALKTWRAAAARAANVPAYVIFHDTTLAAVAERRPASTDDLLAVPGLGPVKAARYGEALLAVVAEHGRSA